MYINFKINDIFNKINQDPSLLKLFTDCNKTIDTTYEEIVRNRIINIYENNNFDLYSYWLNTDNKSISIRLGNINNFINNPNIDNIGFVILLNYNKTIYSEEFSGLDFSSIENKSYVINTLNDRLKKSSEEYIKNNVYFYEENNIVYLKTKEINDTNIVVLEIYNGVISRNKLLEIFDVYENKLTGKLQTYDLSKFLNNELSGYLTLNNIELVDYVFYLEDIEQSYKLDKIRKILLYHFIYLGVDWFFFKNYKSFVPEYDYESILNNDTLKIFLESIFKKLDKIADTINLLKDFNDIDKLPNNFLEHYASIFSYYKEDYNLDNYSFREIIKNIITLYKQKGNMFSIELFFKFIGYSAEVNEYFFDKRELFNSGENPFTGVSNIYDSKHYLVRERPTLSNNKFPIESEFMGLQTTVGDVTEEDITSTKNLFDFERLLKNLNTTQLLDKLGFSAEPMKFNHKMTYNRDKALVGTPKPPYWNGLNYSNSDLVDFVVKDGFKWHQNDFSPFQKSTQKKEVLYNRENLFISDKIVKNEDDFTYFKTNFVTIELTPFKKNLTPIDSIIINRYIDYFLPIYVNKYIISKPNLDSEEITFIGNNESLTYTVT